MRFMPPFADVPFALYEYDDAFARWFSDTIRVVGAGVQSSVGADALRGIARHGRLRVRDRQGLDVSLDESKITTDVTSDLNAVRSGDYEQLYEAMYKSADSLAEQLVGHFVQTIGKVTEGTGNVTDAGGRPFGLSSSIALG